MNGSQEDVIGYEALENSMRKCLRGVGWKDSVAHYRLNAIEENLKLERELKDGTYRPRPQRKVRITHPTRREAVGIAFRDRVYQRSLNDVAIYPAMAESFIRANAACQKDKGTDFARDLLDEFLRRHYRKHGLEGWVLQCDIQGYYDHMVHAVAEALFAQHLDAETCRRTLEVLRCQYGGETGYNPGSQMVQIAGISYLSPLDHLIKERLHIKLYLRYMDDSVHIYEKRDYLEYCQETETQELAQIGLTPHPRKTRIYPVRDGIKMLGFTHKLTATGKVIRLIDPDNVAAQRRKLYRMAQLEKAGKLPRGKTYESFKGWKAHARKGDTHHLITRMNQYYKSLWEESS